MKQTPRKLSTILGIYFIVSIVFLCGLILYWTYYSTSETIRLEIEKSFEQKYSITKTIIERETERIDSLLYEIQLNKILLLDISKFPTPQSQKLFETYIDNSARHKCDVIFITKVDESVWLNASSPVPNVIPILNKIAASSRKFLTNAKIVQFKNNGTDLTGIFKSKKIVLGNGDVIGVVVAGTILNNNLSILNKIKQQTKSPIVIFLDDKNIIASLVIKGNEELKDIVNHSKQGDLHSMKISSENDILDLMLTHFKLDFYGAATPINIIFSMNDNMLVKLKKLYKETLVIISTLFTVFLFLTLYIIRRLIYPSITRMLEYIGEITRKGNHEITLERGSIVELNIIGSAMEKMIASINQSHFKMKESEKALRESEKKYRTLFEKTSDAIFIVNIKTEKYIDANESALKLTARKWSELRQLTTSDITPKGSENRIQKLDKTKDIQDLGQVTYIRPDGEKRVAVLIAIPLSEETVIGIARDITEELILNESLKQSQKMESIGTLAGGIAHDFNNILFPIIGYTEMLFEDIPNDSPFQKSLNGIYTGALRAKDLVTQILTFSRQENREMKLLKISPIIEETLKLVRSTIPTTIKIIRDIKSDSSVVKADPTQIHQIVINLTTNASHAMADSGGELRIGIKEVIVDRHNISTPTMKFGSYVCLFVGDTGLGIPQNIKEKVFDPFYTTKEKGKGTGMGLSVVHGIVASLGGAIEVDSEYGVGTEFRVYLPIVETIQEQQIIKSEEKIAGGTEKILLVDDEKDILAMEKKMLERLGYQVTSCLDSLEALETFRSNPNEFDIVITDMAMPKMAGDKLSLGLVQIRPDIPVLLCTGFSETMSEKKAASMGIKGFLLKPIVMRDLNQKIREMLT